MCGWPIYRDNRRGKFCDTCGLHQNSEARTELPIVFGIIFRTVIGLNSGYYRFEGTHAANAVWIEISKLDFANSQPKTESKAKKEMFKLNSGVTDGLENASPFVVGSNTR